MDFSDFIISDFKKDSEEVYIYQLKKKDSSSVFDFLPGQFCRIKNPAYIKPEETHLFSVSSSPSNKNYIEICLKVYGFWTQTFSQKKVGDIIKISGPYGNFVWDNTIPNAVFLAGGIGISPMISMLRYLKEEKLNPHITLLYGSRTKDSIAYKDELDNLRIDSKNLHIIHILSHLKPEDPWPGYRGFITKEIFQKEVDFSLNPIFFICGPPIFVKLMNQILEQFKIAPQYIRQELFT